MFKLDIETRIKLYQSQQLSIEYKCPFCGEYIGASGRCMEEIVRFGLKAFNLHMEAKHNLTLSELLR